MATTARCLGAVPVEHFFGDYMYVDAAAAGTSSPDFLYELHRAVGDGVDVGQQRDFISAPAIELEKRQPMGPHNVVLGVHADMSRAHDAKGVVTYQPSPGRIKQLLELWRNASAANFMRPQLAAHIAGKRGFLLETAHGRVGRASSLVLVQRQHHDTSFEFTTAMRHAHEFDEALLPRLPTLHLPVAPVRVLPLLVYTDAMFRPRKRALRDQPVCPALEGEGESFHRRFITRLGIVLYDPHCDPRHAAYAPHRVASCSEGFLRYGSAVPPNDVVATFDRASSDDPLKTYIAQVEVLAAVAVYYTFPSTVRGRNINHYIDNTVALSAMIHGYARKVDLAF